VAERTLCRARAGDEHAFRELSDPYRGTLQLHRDRMLGSVQDAEGRLQEKLLAAPLRLARFDGRSSRQVWRYRIATNRCRNAPRDKGRRPRRLEPLAEPPEPRAAASRFGSSRIPMPSSARPPVLARTEGRYELKEAVSLAFVAASSSCRRDTGRCSCCATYSVSEPRRSRRCSRRAKLR
jgi:DNA-directed RNA polymerase specialized sigma24 family protein